MIFLLSITAFLDYYDIPYKVVEVNPISKKEIKWSDYKKVPILVVDGEPLVDSSGSYLYSCNQLLICFAKTRFSEQFLWTYYCLLIFIEWAPAAAIIDKLGHKVVPQKTADMSLDDDEETKWRRYVIFIFQTVDEASAVYFLSLCGIGHGWDSN